MCVSRCVPACVCFFGRRGELQGRGGGPGKGTEFSLLCCFVFSCVAQRKSTTKRGEPELFVCPSLLPSPRLPPLVHSLTYRTLLNGQKWPGGWREPHRQTDYSVEMFVQQRWRKSGRKKEGVRTTWVSPSLRLPSLPLPLLWQRVTIQPHTADKDVQCVFWRKRSQCLNDSLTALPQLQCVCVSVCAGAAEG